jgi:hypothetical protein
VPGYTNPQSLNRYSYVLNNPLRYTDPSGHMQCEEYQGACLSENQMTQVWNHPQNHNNKDDDDKGDGGGDKPLQSPDPIPTEENTNNYYSLLYSFSSGVGASFFSIPLLPPSPFACGWVDCALSAASILASGISTAFIELPVVAGVAVVVDAVVTVIAVGRTNADYHQGEISQERQWILNGTGLIGIIPGPWGLGLSVVNGMATFSGFPP